MGEVVEFPQEERLVWRCNCGCKTHYACGDGSIECANCSNILEGFWVPPENARIKEHDDSEQISNIRDFDDPKYALKSFARRSDTDDICAMIVLARDGRVRTWGEEFETRAQRGWLRRQLEWARKMLVGLNNG